MIFTIFQLFWNMIMNNLLFKITIMFIYSKDPCSMNEDKKLHVNNRIVVMEHLIDYFPPYFVTVSFTTEEKAPDYSDIFKYGFRVKSLK